jgi:hypothetical protein
MIIPTDHRCGKLCHVPLFDMRVGDDLGVDNEGASLPDLDAVQKEALRVLADMAKDLVEFPVCRWP